VIQVCLWDVRRRLVKKVSRVDGRDGRIVLTRHGKGRSVLVSVADAKLLKRLEGEADVAMPRLRLADGKASDYVPHEQILADSSK